MSDKIHKQVDKSYIKLTSTGSVQLGYSYKESVAQASQYLTGGELSF